MPYHIFYSKVLKVVFDKHWVQEDLRIFGADLEEAEGNSR